MRIGNIRTTQRSVTFGGPKTVFFQSAPLQQHLQESLVIRVQPVQDGKRSGHASNQNFSPELGQIRPELLLPLRSVRKTATGFGIEGCYNAVYLPPDSAPSSLSN